MVRRRLRSWLIAIIVLNVAFFASPPIATYAATHNELGWPFPDGQTWYIFQGYGGVTHNIHYYPKTNTTWDDTYAFDLVKDAWNNTGDTAGAVVIAPISGKITYMKDSYDDNTGKYLGKIVNIQIADGYTVNFAHLMNVSIVQGSNVTKGQVLGQVFNGYPGGINHLHMVVHNTQGKSIPLIFGVWHYPSSPNTPIPPNGPWGSSGEWRGTRIDTSSPAASSELLNPSFESGTTAWNFNDAGTCNYQVVTDNAVAQHENNYLAINRNNNTNCNSVSQDVNYSPAFGETYHLKMWMRSTAGTRTGKLVLWGVGGQNLNGITSFSLNEQWQCIETSLVIQRNDHSALRAQVYLDSMSSGDYLLDNAQLSRTGERLCPEATDAILANTFLAPGEWSSGYGAVSDQFLAGDFDGNGYGDLIVASPRFNYDNNPATNDLAWFVAKSTGTGLASSALVANSWAESSYKVFVLDFNGDGKDDILAATNSKNLDNNPATDDLAWYVALSNGSVLSPLGPVANSWATSSYQFYTGDFNGDGKGDVLAATSEKNLDNDPNTNDLAWYMVTSNGTNLVATPNPVMNSWGQVGDQFYVGDFNGDGKDDLINGTDRLNLDNNPATNDLAWTMVTSTGSIFENSHLVASSWGEKADRYFVSDFDGDGKADLVCATARINGDGTLRWYVILSDGNALTNSRLWATRWGRSEDTLLVHNFRKSDYTNTTNFDILAGRPSPTNYKWSVLYADKSDTLLVDEARSFVYIPLVQR